MNWRERKDQLPAYPPSTRQHWDRVHRCKFEKEGTQSLKQSDSLTATKLDIRHIVIHKNAVFTRSKKFLPKKEEGLYRFQSGFFHHERCLSFGEVGAVHQAGDTLAGLALP